MNVVILQSKYLDICYFFVSVFCGFYAEWAIQVF